ncbi:hypothetical protein [Streptomyces fungicidicus]|uniref:hypothetical protein n=1 Tax=Streptomyces fungicidicus TaxID=68203 RepID=UPI0037F16E8E
MTTGGAAGVGGPPSSVLAGIAAASPRTGWGAGKNFGTNPDGQSGDPAQCGQVRLGPVEVLDGELGERGGDPREILGGAAAAHPPQGQTSYPPRLCRDLTQEIINHHRSFIARRRSLRPGEEYREPTAQEWQDFLAHFELRKVALGVCARDFGTPCVHEHACIRCPVLRPDPEQMPRLEEIHANLLDRLQEAKEQGWLGEVAAIEASLAAAEQKLAAMRDLAARHTTVHLGMPDLRGFVARIDSEQRNEDAKRQS